MPLYIMLTLTEIIEERPSKYHKAYDYQIRFKVYAPNVLHIHDIHYNGTYTKMKLNTCYDIMEKIKETALITPYSSSAVTTMCNQLEVTKSHTGVPAFSMRTFIMPNHWRYKDHCVIDGNAIDERITLLKAEVKFLQELSELNGHIIVTYSNKPRDATLVKLSFKEDQKTHVLEFIKNLVEEYTVSIPHLVPSFQLYKAEAYGEKGVVYLKGNKHKYRLYINCYGRKWSAADMETILSLKDVCEGVMIGWGLLYCCEHKMPWHLRETHYIDLQTEEDYNHVLLMCGDLFNKKRTVGQLK